MNQPCNFCPGEICDAPALLIDAISASLSKCGLREFAGHVSTPPKFYLHLEYSETGTFFQSCTYTPPGGSETTDTVNETFNFAYSSTYNAPGCAYVRSPTVCASSKTTSSGTGDCSDAGPDCTGECWDIWAPGSISTGDTLDTTSTTNVETITVDLSGPETGCSTRVWNGTYVKSSTLSSEYTTGMLEGNVVANLPAWPGTFAGGGASRDLSQDESSYSIRRIQWKLKHYATTRCYLKIWLNSTFTPTNPDGTSGTPVVTPLDPYEWNPSGYCLPDPTKPWHNDANVIESDPVEVDEPDENGSTVISILKWSCVPGYEPPDDGSANGVYPP